jgi:RecB family exonuclease
MYAKPTNITAWSFSRYSTYKQCPQKAKYLYIDKLKEPVGQALERGSAIHTLAEEYIKGKILRLPPELKEFADDFKKHRKDYKQAKESMVCEDQWAFTKAWTETQWNDWTHCWLRVKIDFAEHLDEETLRVRDWKTGKFREEQNEDYLEQLSLYALTALMLHPHVNKVITELVYLDQGRVFPDNDNLIFTRADLPKLKAGWEKKVAPMLKDKKFAPRPNDLCRWCHFRKDNGGPCKF